jgi:radical SAM-linked protein
MTSTQDVMDALNQASVPEIRITNVTVLPENAGNAMASVFAAKYTMDFRPGKEPEFFLTDGKPDADKMKESFDQLMAREVIPYEKETKKGVREMNLKEGIFECTFLPETLSFTMTLNASSAGNIKPSQIMESWLKPLGYEVTRTSLRITREEIYVNEGTEDEIKLVPMDQVTGD